jgi:hypothetical protein
MAQNAKEILEKEQLRRGQIFRLGGLLELIRLADCII